MDRGSRLVNLFQSLEKVLGQRSGSRSSEDVQQLRYITSKLLQYVTSQEKIHREMIMKNSGYLDQLMITLEFTEDLCVETNIVHVINELLGKTQTGRKASSLVQHGATQMLLSVLVYEARDPNPPEDLLLLIHQVLAKLATKDRKFGVKARLGQALPVTLNLLKNNISNIKALQPVLHVLKLYAHNAVNASYLGKNSIVTYLFKVIAMCGKKHLTLLKYSLDTLTQLVKSKSNSARAIGQGGVPILLNSFYDWHKSDTKNRHVNLRKAFLNVLKHITNLKSGRKALMEAEGIRILYMTCQETIDCQELEPVIFNASIIMRKCFPRNKLPLDSLRSPMCCPLPDSDFHIRETGEGHGDDEYESSVDNDDDISSEDDMDPHKGDDEDDDCLLPKEPPYHREWEDLKMYETFFPELTQFDVPDDMSPELNGRSAHHCLSASSIGTLRHHMTPNRHSLPNLNDSHISSSLSNMRISSRNQEVTPASAFNLKTGTSVFSLDISSARLNHRSPKGKRRVPAKGGGKKGKQKKNSKEKNDDWLRESQPLCITPMLTSREQNGDLSYLEQGDTDDGFDAGFAEPLESPDIYADISSKTRSVGRFSKIAYPDMHGHVPPSCKEPLHDKKFGVQRGKIFEDIDRMIHPDQVLDHVVYNLDDLVNRGGKIYTTDFSNHSNRDELRVSREAGDDHLHFNSQFESGNLRKVIQIRDYEYDLILNPDVNTNHHHQWFYFEISNMKAGIKYRFNIVNSEKLNSQFNFGMRPVMYSVTEAMQGRPHWLRTGSEICYYKNHYIRSSQTVGGAKGKSYYTATFTITFQHDRDVCYLAYHYPYTYSMLQAHLYKWENSYNRERIYFKNQTVCETLMGNPVPVLTITSYPQSNDADSIQQFKNKPYIFLSGRVHPGESNASWVMKGTINFLLSDRPSAQHLRDMYIFKIVPMLNPDGVINGTHRCSVVAEDLNRRWLHPCPKLHPTIYHCKGLLQYMYAIGKSPLVYCDYHGHSRKKNVFLYGCSPSLSWIDDDLENPAISGNKVEDGGYKTLPRILHHTAPCFSWSNCSFMVEKAKESTARVVVWRQIGVVRSYTMESTYCGCDQGQYKGLHIGTKELEDMGRKFCEALVRVRSRAIKVPSGTSMADSQDPQYRLDPPLEAECGTEPHDLPKESLLEGATALEDTGSDINCNSQSETESENSPEDDDDDDEAQLD